MIEAQLAGIPVVATDVGSNSEVIADGQTGLVVSKNPVDIAAAVAKLASDPDLRRSMGRAAAERALKSFSTEQMIASHALAYVALFRPAI